MPTSKRQKKLARRIKAATGAPYVVALHRVGELEAVYAEQPGPVARAGVESMVLAIEQSGELRPGGGR